MTHERDGVTVHADALCESDDVGEGTRVWAFAHVMRGARVGRHCNIGDGVFIEGGAVVGDECTIKNQVMLWAGVTLEGGVFVGPGAIFTNDRYPRSPRFVEVPEIGARYLDAARWLVRTHVERGASIGAGAIVGPGLRIGAFAMVGAGAVVTRDVAAHALALGNPARAAGWVCACGVRLREATRDLLTCSDCGRRYREVDGALAPAQPDP